MIGMTTSCGIIHIYFEDVFCVQMIQTNPVGNGTAHMVIEGNVRQQFDKE